MDLSELHAHLKGCSKELQLDEFLHSDSVFHKKRGHMKIVRSVYVDNILLISKDSQLVA